MQKARSRLQKAAIVAAPSRRREKGASSTTFKPYLHHLPLLLFAAGFYAGLAWLLATIHPEYIKSWLLPESFLPLHFLLFGGNFFLFTFLTLKKRWGIFIALAIEWLLFLKLQSISLDVWALASALFIGAGGYWLRTWWKNRL